MLASCYEYSHNVVMPRRNRSHHFTGGNIDRLARRAGHSMPKTIASASKTEAWGLDPTREHLQRREQFYETQRNEQSLASDVATEVVSIVVEQVPLSS